MLIIVVLAMGLIVAMAAFAIDVATIDSARHQAQVTADAASLAAAQDVDNGVVVAASATATATKYVGLNDAGATPTIVAPYGANSNQVKVTVTKRVSLAFGGLFGLGSATVQSTAVATSNLTTPLGYFGDAKDLEDGGSPTADGWVNFCAPDGDSNSTSDSDDPPRCPANVPDNQVLDGWAVVHGGVDISQIVNGKSNFQSPNNNGDEMVDLTGTCVEEKGTYPAASGDSGASTSISVTLGDGDVLKTSDNGYCENNADGEIQQPIPTIPQDTYTVTFYMGSNTYGYPYEKSLMMVASNTDLSTLPPMADTDGNDSYHSAANNGGKQNYGTVYPLEKDSSAWASDIIASQEFVYAGTTGGDTPVEFQLETFTFTATGRTTYLGFGALTDCVPDWTSSSSIKDNYFWFNPASVESDAPGTDLGAGNAVSSTTTFEQPPAQVHADVQSPWYDQCKYGPGISDLTITGPNAVQLTQ